MATYNVQPGDTLGAIAARNNLTLPQLLKLNPNITNPNVIAANQPITLPDGPGGVPGLTPAAPARSTSRTPQPSAEPPTTAKPTIQLLGATYYPLPGDTWASIAAKEGVSVADLLAANPGMRRAEQFHRRVPINLPAHARNSLPIIVSTGITFSSAPYYNQGDPRWAKDQMLGGDTIQQSGCAMTCVSSALAAKSIYIDNEVACPKTLNAWLNRNRGYTEQSWLKWEVLKQLAPTKIEQLDDLWQGRTLDLYLRRDLDAMNVALIAELSFKQHYVLLTDHDDGATFSSMDPNGGRNVPYKASDLKRVHRFRIDYVGYDFDAG